MIPQKTELLCGAMMIDPPIGQVTTIDSSHVVILFSKPVAMEGYLAECQTLINRVSKLLVLLLYRTRADYDAALISVNPSLR